MWGVRNLWEVSITTRKSSIIGTSEVQRSSLSGSKATHKHSLYPLSRLQTVIAIGWSETGFHIHVIRPSSTQSDTNSLKTDRIGSLLKRSSTGLLEAKDGTRTGYLGFHRQWDWSDRKPVKYLADFGITYIYDGNYIFNLSKVTGSSTFLAIVWIIIQTTWRHITPLAT
jgi:hypothetical protein